MFTWSRWSWVVCGLGVAAACSTETGGGGGAGGSAGHGGAGSGASSDVGASMPGGGGTSSSGGGSSTGGSSNVSSTGGSSTGGGATCVFSPGSNPCPNGQYCNSPGCLPRGTCAPQPSSAATTRDPVCGCDDITYWNADVAGQRGASVATDGACLAGASCGGFIQMHCPAEFASCNYKVDSNAACDGSDLSGDCWALPDTCDVVDMPTTHGCSVIGCAGECTLIRTGNAWYDDDPCSP